jgi:hypothetical protein
MKLTQKSNHGTSLSLLEPELVKQILTFWKTRQVGQTLKVGN